MNCSVGVMVGVLEGVKVRVGVKVNVGVGVGVLVGVGVKGGVTTIATLNITVRELVAVIVRVTKGTRLGRIGLNWWETVATIRCLLSLRMADVRVGSVVPVQYVVAVVLGPLSYLRVMVSKLPK